MPIRRGRNALCYSYIVMIDIDCKTGTIQNLLECSTKNISLQDISQVRELFSSLWSKDEEEIVQIGQKMVDLQHSKTCQTVTKC